MNKKLADQKLPIKRTKAEIRNENETRILCVAERVFSENGYLGASMQQIADLTSLPKSNVLYYFQSKQKLYCLVLENMFKDWITAADTFENNDDPGLVISNYVRAKMKLARERPFGSTVWAKEMMSGAPLMGAILAGELNRWTQERIAILEKWILEGKMTISDPSAFLYMIWASTQHYADFRSQLIILNNNQEFSDEEFEEKTLALTQMILGSAGLKSTSS